MDHCEQGVFCTDVDQRERKCNYFLCNRFEPQIGNDELLSVLANKMQRTIGVSDPNSEERISSKIQGDKTNVPTSHVTSAEVLAQREEAKEMNLGGVLASQLHAEKEMAVVCPDISILVGNQSVEDVPLEGVMTREVVEQMPPYTTIASRFCVENELTSELVRGHVTANVTLAENSLDSDLFAEGKVTGGILTCDLAANSFAEVPTDSAIIEVGSNSVPSSETLPTNRALVEHRLVKPPAVTTVSEDMFVDIEVAKMDPLEGVRTNHVITESKLPAVPLDTGATVEMSAKGEGVIEVSGEGIPASAVFVVGLLPVVHADDKATIAVLMEGEVTNQVPSESTKINGLFAENGLSKIFQGLNLGVEMSAECEKSSEVTEVSVPPNVMVSGPKVVAGSMGMSTDEGAIDKDLGDVAITNVVTAECPFTTAATKVSEACESAAKIDVVINNGMTAEKPLETTEAKLMSAGYELTTEMSGEVVKTCEHPSIGVTTKIFVDDVLANNIHREPMTTNETTEVPTDITSTLEMSAEDEEVEDMSGESVASLHLCVTAPMEIAAGEVTSDGSAENLTTKEMPTKMSVEEDVAQGLKNDMMSSVPPDNTTAVVSSDHEMFPDLPGEVVTTIEVTEVPPDVPVAMEISADCVSPNKVSEDVETANGVVSIYADKTVNNVLDECFAISEMEEVTPETTAAKEVSSDSEIFAGMSAGGVPNGEASDTASTLRISTKVLGNEVSDVGAACGGVSNVSPNTTVKRPEEHVIICNVFRESATSNIMTAEPLDSTTTMNISSDAELSGEVVMTSGVAEVPPHTIGTLEKTGKGGLAKEEFGEGLTTNVQVSVHPLLAVAKEMTERIPDTTEIVEILSCANTRDDVTTDGMIQVPLDSAATIEGEIANVSEEGGTINRMADVPPDPATVDTPAECLIPDFISGKVVTANRIVDRSPDTTAIVETSEIIESCGKTMLIGEIPEVPADVSTPLGRSLEIVMTELPDECLNTEAARDTCEGTTTMEVASDGATIAEPFGECVITSTETDVTPHIPVTTVTSARGVMADQISDDVEGTDALAFIPSDTFAGNLSAECVIPNEASGEVVTTDGIIEVPPGTTARLPMSAESDGSNKPAGEDTITNEVVELFPDTTASVTANDDHGNNVTTSVVAGVPPEATATMEIFSEVERETDMSGEDVTTSRMTEVPPDMIVTMEISGEGGIAAVVSGNEVVTNVKAEVPQAPTGSVLLPGWGEGAEIDIVVSGEDVTSNMVSEVIPDTAMSSVMSAERVIPAEMVSMNPDIPRSDVVADIVSEEREMTEEVAEILGDTITCGEVLANGEILSQDSGEDVRTNGMAKLLLNTMGAMEMSVECEMSGESLTSEMKEVTPAIITASVEFSSYLSGESVTAIEITEAVPSTTEMMETAVDDKITNCIPAEDVRANGMAEVHLHTTSTVGMFAESKMVSDVSGERATTNEMIEVPTAIVTTVEVSSDHMVSSSDLSGEGTTIYRMIEASPDTTGTVEMVTENEKATEASGKVDMNTKDRAEGLPGTTTTEISSDGATIAEPFGECLITDTETDAPITTVISARADITVVADQMSDDVEGIDALAFIPSDTFAGDLSAGCVIPNEVSGEVVTTDGIIEVPPGTTAILQMSAESDASNKPAGEDTITNELVEISPDTSVSLSNSEEGIIANDGYQCGAADEKTEVPAGRVMTEMSDDGKMFTALPGQVMKTNWMSEAPSEQTMSAEGAVANRRSAESVTNEIVEVPPDFLPTTMEMSTQGQITSELSAEGVPNCEVVSVYPGVMTAQVSFSEGVKANELAGEDIQTNGLAEMEMTAEADVDTEILGESVATTELAENTRAAKDTSECEMVIEHPEVVRTTEMAETPSDLRVSCDLAGGSIVNNEISGKNIAILALASVCLSMLGTIQLPTEGDILNKVSGEGTSLGVTDILPDAKVGTFVDTSASGESVINNYFKEFLNKAVAMETSTEGAEPDKVSEDMVTSKVTEAPADLAAAMEMTVDSVVTNDVFENVTPSEIAPGLLCALLTKGISAESVEVQDVSEEDITTAGMTNMPPDAILSVKNSAEDEGNAVITESFANSGVTELPHTYASTLGNSAESKIPIEPSGELVLTSGVSKELPAIAASLEMAAGRVTIEGERADEMSGENETADQVPRNAGTILEISSESDGTTSIGEAEHLLHVTAAMEVSGPGVIDNEVSEKHAVSFGLPSAVALEDEISSEDVKASNQSGEGATTNPVVEMPQGATSTREDEETTEISEEGVVTNRLTEVPTPAATATIQMSTMGHLADEMSDKEVATRNVASEQPGVLVTKGISVTGVGANETLEDDVKTSDVIDVPPDTAMPLEISVDGEQASEMSKRDTAINANIEILPEITGTTEIIPDVEITNDVPGEGAKHNGMFGENMSAKVFPDPAIAMETFAQNMIVKPVPIECQSSVSEVSSQMDSDILLTNNTEVEVMAKIKGAKLVSEGLAAIMLNQMPSGGRSNNGSRKRKASESLADVCAYRPSNALCCAGHWCTTVKVIERELQSVSVMSTDHTSLHLQSEEQLVNRVGNEHSLPVSDRSLGTFGAVKYQREDKERSLCYRNTMKENNSMLKMEELNSAKLYNFAYCNPLFSKLQLIDRSALRFDCCHREDHKYDTCDMVIGASQLEETKPKNIHVPPVNSLVGSKLSGELLPIEKISSKAGYMVSAKRVRMEPASLHKLEMLQAMDMCSTFQTSKWMDLNFCLNTELKSCWNSPCVPNFSQDQYENTMKLQPLTWSSGNYWVPRSNHTQFVTPIFPVSSNIKLAPIFSSLTISDEAVEQCISKRTDWSILPYCSSEDSWTILQWLNGLGKNSWPLSTLCKSQLCTCTRLKFGLPTILALSSPGCYRVWTRRHCLGSRIPTVQRMLLTQFEEHLKGLNTPIPLDKRFPSMLCILGRIVSWWNQHGPSFTSSTGSTNNCRRMSMGSSPSYFLSDLITKNGTDFSGAKPLLLLQTSQRTDVRPLNLRELCPAVSDLPISPAECSVTDLSIFPTALPTSPRVSCVENQLCSEQKEVCAAPDETKRKPKGSARKVSQIRIRKTIPKQDTNLTPMGLPKPKRLKKKEFSLEEIYTNKNYKSPSANSKYLETIFEEPVLKKGSFVCTSLQKRKRLLEFQDYTLPRKRRAHSGVKIPSRRRCRKTAPREGEIDSLLIQKLTELEAFLSGED